MWFIRSHIHGSNMAWGWLAEERFDSSMTTVGWNVVVPYWVGFWIFNKRLFLLIISWVLYWFILELYGYCFLPISVVIMLVINMHYDSVYAWIPSRFYLYMNEYCICGLMDKNIAKAIRKQCLIESYISMRTLCLDVFDKMSVLVGDSQA